MKRLTFEISINAPVGKVYDEMLGISDPASYMAWVVEFNPSSTFEGSWEKGSRIKFIGVDENGVEGGLVVEVVENKPNEFVSLRTIGIIDKGEEILTGEKVDAWLGGYENYTYREENGITTVRVDVDSLDDFVEYFSTTYPKALQKLKSNIESDS